MSEGARMPLDKALRFAESLKAKLLPACERIEIAGSIRRKKPDIGDIEMCCIPVRQKDLFGGDSNSLLDPLIDEWCANTQLVRQLKGGDKYKQLFVSDGGVLACKLDLFITTPECWGVIFAIRTGPPEFSHKFVTPRRQGGLLPSHLKVKDLRVWAGDTALDTDTEEKFFAALELAYIPPEKR